MSLSSELQQRIDKAAALLKTIAGDYAPAAFANSFGAEDMVLTDLICTHAPGIEIFTIDTGRLPEETYQLMQAALERYGVRFKTYFPERRSVEEYVRHYGPNAFYQSVELRK